MKKVLILLAVFAVLLYPAADAFARAGGGRSGGGFRSSGSYGSRGSRTYSTPASPGGAAGAYSGSPSSPNRASAYAQPSYPQPAGGGFMRGLMGGLIGGVLGSLLFSSLGFAGHGYTGGLFGGIGIFEIIIIALGVFLIFRLMRRKEAPAGAGYNMQGMEYSAPDTRYAPEPATQPDAFSQGINDIKRFDSNFRENDFKEEANDIFFKVQAAWMNRDIAPVAELLGSEITALMRADISKLKQEGRINRLENIAVREVAITEAWREEGVDYITVRITANVLDYVTDEKGTVVEGSKTEPVKFVEYWTYSRPVGKARWQLGAIQQDN